MIWNSSGVNGLSCKSNTCRATYQVPQMLYYQNPADQKRLGKSTVIEEFHPIPQIRVPNEVLEAVRWVDKLGIRT